MAHITLRVLDGADRGKVYSDLPTPITIGREEGNAIQLNDERVSRFHAKIQEDKDKLVLTDLESTNGSKVNGEDVQLRILRHGDIIHVGRSLLLYGTREQIAERLSAIRRANGDDDATQSAKEMIEKIEAASLDEELNWNEDPDLQQTLHTLFPPDLPEGLGPSQAAQLVEVFEYLHVRLRDLLNSIVLKAGEEQVMLDMRQWQTLVDVQSRLAEYLRTIADPER